MPPTTFAGDIPDVWPARIQKLEEKLEDAERELIAEGISALDVRALAEFIRNEIATLKSLSGTRSAPGQCAN
jgi:hypothetical protein